MTRPAEGRSRPDRPQVRRDGPGDLRPMGQGPRPRPRRRDAAEDPKGRPSRPSVSTSWPDLRRLSRRPTSERDRAEGRAVWRRLNRYEYENALRDLLAAPWLQLRDMLPEDGEAHRFNKSGEALDVSHVQMARYLAAAEYALRRGDRDPGRATRSDSRALLRPGAAELHRQDEVRPVQQPARAGDVPDARPRGPAGRPGGEGPRDGRRGRPGDAASRRRSASWPAATSRSSRSSTGSRRRRPAGTGCGSRAYSFWAGPGKGRRSGGSRTATTSRSGRTAEPVTIYVRDAAAAAADARRVRRRPRAGGPRAGRLAAGGRDDPARRGPAVPLAAAELAQPAGQAGRAARASPSAGWRSRGRSTTSGRRPATRLLFGDLPLKSGPGGRGRGRLGPPRGGRRAAAPGVRPQGLSPAGPRRPRRSDSCRSSARRWPRGPRSPTR